MRLCCRIPLASFDLEIDVTFDAKVTAIFGPSGSGKTTLLDAIAGLKKIASGEIEVNGRALFSSKRGIDLPPRERGVGYVPQEAALFPHLSVRKNILFGARRRSLEPTVAAIGMKHVVEVLEIGSLLDRPVSQISGGEAQRVALARAIVSRPQLLLLDEPLASLDIGMKEKILPYLARVRDKFAIPIIYVTHNISEVLSLADWIVMIRRGRFVAQGPPRQALRSTPALRDLEEEPLDNILSGAWLGGDQREGTSRVRLASGREVVVRYAEPPAGQTLQLKVSADDILVATKRPEAISAANVLPGTITQLEPLGGQVLLEVEAGGIFSVRITAAAVNRLNLTVGKEVFLIIKARAFRVL